MALRNQIPVDRELDLHRELKYRVRCAWGGNHIRKLDANGSVMTRAEARNSAPGHSIAPAVDGFRPHENPLNPSYEGYWESTGVPLEKTTTDLQTYYSMTDWTNWTTGLYGNAAGARTYADDWGKMIVRSVDGNRAGMSQRIGPISITSKSVFQFQCVSSFPTPSAPGKYFRVGFILADSALADPFAANNYNCIYIESSIAGGNAVHSLVSYYKTVALGEHSAFDSFEIPKSLLNSKFLFENDGDLMIFASFLNPYGGEGENIPQALGSTIYAYFFVETNETTEQDGYCRDFAHMPELLLTIAGENGYHDEFDTFDLNVWNLTTKGGDASLLSQITDDGESAIWLRSAGVNWACCIFDGLEQYGDFHWKVRAKKLADYYFGLLFRMQDKTGNSTQCYGICFRDTEATLFKDLGADGGSWITTLESNTDIDTAAGEIFDVDIYCQGNRIKILKNDVVVFDTRDDSYSSGYIGAQTLGNQGGYFYEWEMDPRGLQVAVGMRLDKPMLENPSFELWASDNGVPGTIEVADSWNSTTNAQVIFDRGDGYNEYTYCQKVTYSPISSPLFATYLMQYGLKYYAGHKYRITFRFKIISTETTLNPEFMVYLQINGYDIKTINPNNYSFNEWHTIDVLYECNTFLFCADFTFYMTNPVQSSQSFSYCFDDVMVEDITGLATPEYEWKDRPPCYRSLMADRGSDSSISGYDAATIYEEYDKCWCAPPLNKIWRTLETTTWGLVDENGRDIFTSRPYSSCFPSDEWTITPQWINIDFGIQQTVNQVIYYALYNLGARWMILSHGNDVWYVGDDILRIMNFLPEEGFNKFDLETEENIEDRFWQVIFLDSYEEGDMVTCCQLEFYYFSDESVRILQAQGSGPEVSIAIKRSQEINSMPDAATAVVSIKNYENRYNPRNIFSPIYGFRQLDGLGDIRPDTPIKISILMDWTSTDTGNIITYETLLFLGTIGKDQNEGGALGISIDSTRQIATIDAVDFSSGLDQPTPIDELDVLEDLAAEEVLRKLCYLAGIPRQDLEFDETGQTFEIVIFDQQTLREQIQQIVTVLGGRFFPLPDGKLMYRNVSVYRTWTQEDRADFGSGVKDDIDIDSVPGEARIGNVLWHANNNFDALPEDEETTWTVNDPDSSRLIVDGKYEVMTASSSSSKMTHVREDNFDKTQGFTLEWDVELIRWEGSYNPTFDVWGYTNDVVDFYTVDCAWRIEIARVTDMRYRFRIGGKTNSYEKYPEPQLYKYYADGDFKRCRIRLEVLGNNYKVYCNEELIGTFTLCTPGQIRWPFFESETYLKDTFTESINKNLALHIPDENKTRDIWHDPTNTWLVNAGGYCELQAADIGGSYLDFGIPNYIMESKLYLDRTTADEGGYRIHYKDSQNHLLIKFVATPYMIIPFITVKVYLYQVVGGIQTLIKTGTTFVSRQGSHKIKIENTNTVVKVYVAAPDGSGGYTSYYMMLDKTWNAPGFLPGETKFGFYGKNGSGISFDDLEVIINNSTIYPPIEDDYVGKVVIGPVPPEVETQKNPTDYPGWIYLGGGFNKVAYRLDYFRQYFSGAIDPVTSGTLYSRPHDCTADIDDWGILEAAMEGIKKEFRNIIPSWITFYVSVSDDGVTWDDWVEVIPGEKINAAIKRWIKWRADFIKIASFYRWRTPILKSVTINWMIGSQEVENSFRATYNLYSETSESVIGQEFQSLEYSIGNPVANRVTVLVNRLVEQAMTNYEPGTSDPFWESEDLPKVLANGEIYEIYAKYYWSSKKGAGADLRHVHLTIDGADYSVDDGTSDQVCGNTTVSFSSGQSIGHVTVVSTAPGTSLDAVAIDAVGFKPASELYGTESVFAEDTEAQSVTKRVIVSKELDNPFAMNRDIAELFAESYLVEAKKYSEQISNVILPLKPNLNLGQYGIVHAPYAGLFERQVELCEMDHTGFRTTISARGVKTDEETIEFDPITISPDGIYAMHRLTNCQSAYIVRMRRASDGAFIDVYDFRKDFEQYKISESGNWIDGSDEIYYLRTWYDQSGNGNDATQVVDANQPRIYLGELIGKTYRFNGWPTLYFDGSNDYLSISYDISPSVTPEITILAIISPTKPLATRAKIYGHDNGGFDRTIGLDNRAASNNLAYTTGAGYAGAGNIALGPSYAMEKYLLSQEYTDLLCSVWINGINTVDEAAVANGDGQATFFIGSFDGSTEFWKGYIEAFFLFPSVLTEANRQNAEAYLNGRYSMF